MDLPAKAFEPGISGTSEARISGISEHRIATMSHLDRDHVALP